MATAYVIAIKERLVTIVGMIVNARIMRNVNGVFVRLIAATADVMVMRIVGSAAVTALVLVIRGVIILELVRLIAVMVNVMVMRIV